MKKLVFVLAVFRSLFAAGQTVILSENIGTPGATTVISAYAGWQNGLPFSFASTSVPESDVRNTTNSTGYNGASGGGNVFFTNVIGRDFVIGGINTVGFSGITLSFGHYKSSTSGNNELLVEVSEDGSSYFPLTYSRPTGTGTANWVRITTTGSIPAISNLRIRFRQSSTITQFRIDDIVVTGISVLPVQLSGVRAFRSGEAIEIEWTNLTEADVKSYWVERSRNAIDFFAVSEISPLNNDETAAHYRWRDENPYSAQNFYRVKVVETNGNTVSSSVLRVERKGVRLSVYPNPVAGSMITVQAELPRGIYPFFILNAVGTKVHSGEMNHAGGIHTESIDLPDLRPGIYFLVLGEYTCSIIKR